MSYTPENNPYIPGDPYSYDLKWMVKDIKHMEERFGELDSQVQEATDQADRAEQEADRSDTEALKSEGFAIGEQDETPVDPDSPYYENNAKFYAEKAQTDGHTEALKSEGFAIGEQDGTPVSSGPYYQNNSKYYSQAAAGSAAEAAGYAAHIADPVAGLVTDWLAANITQPTTPAIDTSLTVGGAAADALVTGDRIRALETKLFGVIGTEFPIVEIISLTGRTGQVKIDFDTLYVDTNYGGNAVRFYDTDGVQITALNIPTSGRATMTIDLSDPIYASAVYVEAYEYDYAGFRMFGYNAADMRHELDHKIDDMLVTGRDIYLSFTTGAGATGQGNTGLIPITFDRLYFNINYNGSAVRFYDNTKTEIAALAITAAGRLARTVDLSDAAYASAEYVCVYHFDLTADYSVFVYNSDALSYQIADKVDGQTGYVTAPGAIIDNDHLYNGTVGNSIHRVNMPGEDSVYLDVSNISKIKISGYSWDLSHNYALCIFTTSGYTVLSKYDKAGYFTDIVLDVPAGAKWAYVNGDTTVNAIIKTEGTVTDFDTLAADSYKGKTFLMLGDSITQLGNTGRGWITYFDMMVSAAQIDNVAVIGAHFCDMNDHTVYDGDPQNDGTEQNVVGNQIQKIINNRANYLADYDYVFVAAGTNDSIPTLPITTAQITAQYFSGSSILPLANVDRSTWPGASRYIVETLQQLFPTAEIIFVTPIHRILGYSASVLDTTEAIRRCADAASVRVCDATRSGIRMTDTADFVDGLHPSAAGAQIMGKYIGNWFVHNYRV